MEGGGQLPCRLPFNIRQTKERYLSRPGADVDDAVLAQRGIRRKEIAGDVRGRLGTQLDQPLLRRRDLDTPKLVQLADRIGHRQALGHDAR